MTQPDQLNAVIDTVGAIIDKRTGSTSGKQDQRHGEFDRDLWRELTHEFGLCAMHAPEELGGAGDLGLIVAAVKALGSRLSTLPYLPTVVLGTMPLLAAQRTAEGDEVLGALLQGEQTATAALDDSLRVRDGNVAGTAMQVLHGASADWLLVSTEGQLWGIRAGDLRPAPYRSMDLTRPLADVTVPGARALLLGAVPPDQRARMRHELMTFLAHESAAGSQRVVSMAVEYARVREQFGRAIGSFQAVKHLCAEMTIDAEAAAASAWSASTAIRTPDHPLVSLAAFVYSTEAYVRTARESLHVHGGIGFTWEFSSHLYYRRAHANMALLGSLSALKMEYARELVAARGIG